MSFFRISTFCIVHSLLTITSLYLFAFRFFASGVFFVLVFFVQIRFLVLIVAGWPCYTSRSLRVLSLVQFRETIRHGVVIRQQNICIRSISFCLRSDEKKKNSTREDVDNCVETLNIGIEGELIDSKETEWKWEGIITTIKSDKIWWIHKLVYSILGFIKTVQRQANHNHVMEYSVMEYSVELATIQFDIKFGVNPDIKLGGKLCIDFDIKRVRIATRSVT